MGEEYEIKRVPTGVPGFDEMIEGGFVNDDSYVLAGMPGTGKTIFALQFLWNGATQYGENGLFVTIEQKIFELKRQALRFGWDFDKIADKVAFIKIPITQSEFDILDFIQKEAEKIKAKRIIIDSISVIAINAPMFRLPLSKPKQKFDFAAKEISSLPTTDRIKQFVYLFISSLKEIDSTLLFVAESPKETGEFLTRDTVSEFVCDGVITFHYISGLMTGGYERGIRIIKMRSTNHKTVKGKNDCIQMQITDKGIVVKGKS